MSQLDNLAIALDHDYNNELLAPDENGFFRQISDQYTNFDRSDGRKFGRPAYVYMYWRGLREEGGKKYYDYYYARSFKLVQTEEIAE